MNPDLQALTAYSGKYQQALLGKLYRQLTLDADGIQVIPNVKNTLTLGRLAVGKGWKPYSGKFNSSDGQLKYTDRALTVQPAQRDIEIEPEKYRTTWLSEFVPGTSSANDLTIPFAQFTWQEIMNESAQEIVEMLYYGKGKAAFATYSAGTAYNVGNLVAFVNTAEQNETQYYKCIAATSAGQSPLTTAAKWTRVDNLAITKGFGAVFTDAINNEGFNAIVSTGAITSTTAYDQFTSVWRALPEQIKMKGALIYCSVNSLEYLMDDYESKVKKYFDVVDNIVYLGKTNQKCILKPVSWLSGSSRLIATPAKNLVLGTDALSDMNTIRNIPQHYSLQTSMKVLLGTQVRDLDVLVLNDQA